MTEPEEADALRLAREIANSYRGANPTGQSPKRKSRPAKPARPNRDEPSALGDVLGELVENQGWTEKLASQRVFTDWPKIVGAEVAQHSEVIAFEDGVVEVRANKTAWAKELTFLAPRIVAKLNEAFGDGSVLRIEVRGPQAPSWKKGVRSVKGRGPRDTYG